VHLKPRDAGADGAALSGGAEEGACGGALGLDHVIGIVAEGLAGFQLRKLADDAIALHHERVAIGIADDPFAAKDIHGFLGVVMNGDVIDERVGSIWRCRPGRIVLDLIHRNGQASEMLEADVHGVRLRAKRWRVKKARRLTFAVFTSHLNPCPPLSSLQLPAQILPVEPGCRRI